MYTIDLATILSIVQGYAYNGYIEAELDTASGLSQRATAQIILKDGRIVSCFIFRSDREILLSDREAFQFLSGLGKITWTLIPQEEYLSLEKSNKLAQQTPRGLAQSSPPPQKSILVPRRLREVDTQQLASWPLRVRAIYRLVDGKRDLHKIATMLSLSVESIQPAIQELQFHKVITVEEKPT